MTCEACGCPLDPDDDEVARDFRALLRSDSTVAVLHKRTERTVMACPECGHRQNWHS